MLFFYNRAVECLNNNVNKFNEALERAQQFYQDIQGAIDDGGLDDLVELAEAVHYNRPLRPAIK